MITPEKIRNVAMVAHGGAGKTTLIETILFQAKAIASRGRSSLGTAVMRTEPEEVTHRVAITPHICHCEWQETTINIIDTPGYFNFLESTRGVLPGVDSAIVVVSGVDGVKPEAERLWNMLQDAKLPTLCFVNFLDEEQADFMQTMSAVQESFKIPSQAITIPIRAGAHTQGIVDLLSLKAWATKDGKTTPMDIPSEMQGDINTLRTQLIEKIAESNDDLLEKYLEGSELSSEELTRGLKAAIIKRAFLPVLSGSATAYFGIDALLDAVVHYLPSPIDRDLTRPFIGADPADHTKEVKRSCNPNEKFSAVVLKTTIDPFSGKLSVVRVVSGAVKANQAMYNSTRQSKQKNGHIFLLQGKELTGVDALVAGQIGALAKLEDTHTGDTLCDSDPKVCYPLVKFADPPVVYAVESEDKNDEKVASGLAKLMDEDPTLHLKRDEQTHEMILAGMGQTHIEVALERLTRKFGGKAKLKTPQVPYRETIRKTIKAQGKLKKQTGGHGQFANCWLEVGPLPRNGGFDFVDQITGGIIPKQFIPSIKKGVQEAMTKGLLGGYPVVDVRVAVYDGSFHDVDSSDYAFQVAGSLGFKAAVEQAAPVLLEPIMVMDVIVPDENTGDVLKDLSSRRGRVMSLNNKGKLQQIEAEVPMAETLDYGNVLSGLTSGRGTYTMSISSYREVPAQIQDKVLEAVKKKKEAQAEA